MTNPSYDITALKTLAPFRWFTEDQLDWALPTIEHRVFTPRTTILHDRLHVNGLFILLSGHAEFVFERTTGRRFIATIFRAHQFFGEHTLFGESYSNARVVAIDRCEALFIPRPVVLECLKSNSQATLCVLEKLTKRATAAQRKLAQLALQSVDELVARALVEHTPRGIEEQRVGITTEQIAGLVGCSREMVSRTVRALREQGLIKRSGRDLVICDRSRLENLSQLP